MKYLPSMNSSSPASSSSSRIASRRAELSLISTSGPTIADTDDAAFGFGLPSPSPNTATTPVPDLWSRYFEDRISGRRVLILDRPNDNTGIDPCRGLSQTEEPFQQTWWSHTDEVQEEDDASIVDLSLPCSPNGERLTLLSPRAVFDSREHDDVIVYGRDEGETEAPVFCFVSQAEEQSIECHSKAETANRSATDSKPEAGEISYWPALVSYLADPHAHAGATPKVNCAICREGPLKVAGISTDEGDLRDPPEKEHALVLPCGHILGARCMRSWKCAHERVNAEEMRPDRPLQCPLCKFDLVFPVCRHAVPGVPAPVDPSGDDFGQVPETVPEGGFVPNECHYCARISYIKERELHHLQLMIMRGMPIDVVEESLDEIDYLRSRFSDDYDQLCSRIPSWADPRMHE